MMAKFPVFVLMYQILERPFGLENVSLDSCMVLLIPIV